jgi:hypothetical protein
MRFSSADFIRCFMAFLHLKKFLTTHPSVPMVGRAESQRQSSRNASPHQDSLECPAVMLAAIESGNINLSLTLRSHCLPKIAGHNQTTN